MTLTAFDRRVLRYLNRIGGGAIAVRCSDGTVEEFGAQDSSHRVEITLHNPSFIRRLATNPSLALGEAYIDGQWDISQGRLAELFGILWRDAEYRPDQRSLSGLISRAFRNTIRSNSPSAASFAVRSHYDQGDSLFRLFLDSSMTYSCGYVLDETDSLEAMQAQKHELICQKLGLDGPASLIDLGCGWGGFMFYVANRHSDISCMGVTLSRNQLEHIRRQTQEAGVDNRVKAELADYRDAPGRGYDFLVSIGMFEHLGKADHATFMETACRLLKTGGRGLLHTMAITDDPDEPPDAWISKYIFPRHRLPRIEELVRALRRAGLRIGHVENLKPHYAETFRRWGENLRVNRNEILSHSRLDERFFRMWEYYLHLCEAGFRYGSMEVYQILFCNGDWSFPARFEFGLRPNTRPRGEIRT